MMSTTKNKEKKIPPNFPAHTARSLFERTMLFERSFFLFFYHSLFFITMATARSFFHKISFPFFPLASYQRAGNSLAAAAAALSAASIIL